MIVEFMGTSGAGKSTLIPILLQLLRDDGRTAMSATQAILYNMRNTFVGRLVCALTPPALHEPVLWNIFSLFFIEFYTIRFIVGNPRLAGRVIQLQFRRPIPWRHKWLIVWLFFEMASWRQFLQRRLGAEQVLVFDEGFVHRATHMFVSEAERVDPDQIRDYMRLIPRSDWVISVQSPLNTCLARIHAKGLQPRLRNLGEDAIAKFIANAEQVTNIASQCLRDAGWRIIEVENQGDLTVCAAQLRRLITAHVFPVATAAK